VLSAQDINHSSADLNLETKEREIFGAFLWSHSKARLWHPTEIHSTIMAYETHTVTANRSVNRFRQNAMKTDA
jgi:hypothetical protein